MSLQNELNSALENVNEVQYQTRLSICAVCPALSAIKVCKDCLCVIPVKAKLKSQKCPRNLWR